LRFFIEFLRKPRGVLGKNGRFLIPVGLVVIAKILGSLFLYYRYELGSLDSYWMLVETALSLPQNMVLHQSLSTGNRWLYLYVGWDTAWYLSILKKGYGFSSQSYAFFPGLTIMGRLVKPLFKSTLHSTFVVVALLGLAWIPVYQMLAERRMSERDALLSTI
jgi:hypothetical protein